MQKPDKGKKTVQKNNWVLLVPMYVFTILFVGLPFIYLFVLSFQSRAEVWGIDWTFTLDNYKRIY